MHYTFQFQYSPRNVSGFGLTDGEGVERLWSYLRRFSRMTKEMRPSHRIDVLTDALLHYAQQAIKRLCKQWCISGYTHNKIYMSRLSTAITNGQG